MAHASNREKGILQMKKYRKAKSKRKMEWNTLTDEERAEIEEKRNTRTLKDKVANAIWDYKRLQFPIGRYDYLEKLLNERLEEDDVTMKEKEEINEVLKNVRR